MKLGQGHTVRDVEIPSRYFDGRAASAAAEVPGSRRLHQTIHDSLVRHVTSLAKAFMLLIEQCLRPAGNGNPMLTHGINIVSDFLV